MKKIIIAAAVCAASGCAFILQDGDELKKHYGIRGGDAVALAQMIRSARGAGAPEVIDAQAPVVGTQSGGTEPEPLKIK